MWRGGLRVPVGKGGCVMSAVEGKRMTRDMAIERVRLEIDFKLRRAAELRERAPRSRRYNDLNGQAAQYERDAEALEVLLSLVMEK